MRSIKNVKIAAECPICKEKNFARNIRIVKETDGGQLSHIICEKCRAAFVVLVAQSALGVSAYSLLTDLGREEVGRVLDAERVTADDVVDLHEKLKGTVCSEKKYDKSESSKKRSRRRRK
jgi:transcription elongation factor Elf1